MRLFAKVKAVLHEKASLNLNPEQTFMDENIKVFSKWSQSYGRQNQTS
jgi:hypothetical protein